MGGLFLVCFGTLAGYIIGVNYEQSILISDLSVIRPIRENDTSYKFINPLLAYIIPGSDQQEGFKVLKQKIINVIDTEKKQRRLIDASVFLSDLNAGRWIGVNENQKYNPASILKVVIMVAYFKESERDPDTLTKKLSYTAELDQLLGQNNSHVKSELEIGKNYNIEELIKKMITESDNGAEITLLASINKPILDSLYKVLSIENPEDLPGNFTISPRSYSLFFRILYSATYLDKSLSERALEILSQTTFEEGIVAGVSKAVPVAHKFGEYVNSENNQIKDIELHDCGIVYYSNSPYFLCVMTKGNNLDSLKNTIKNISSLVYENYTKSY